MRTYVDTLFDVVDRYELAIASVPVDPELKQRVKQLHKQADLEFLKEDTTALVKESIDGLKRVKDIVQALKDFSHVGESDWQIADLHHGLDSTLNIVNNEIKYKAKVIKEYDPALPQIKCLASQLNQVFMNLLVNAAHAIKESGAALGGIRIRTGHEAEWVWVEVTDTGCGIPPENLNRIFEPFFTTKPVGSGTGLGLSLSYGIVNKHGGKIDVASEVGKGARFTVRLPVAPPDAD
jgi:two-component system, NtrC family, sensor kinase